MLRWGAVLLRGRLTTAAPGIQYSSTDPAPRDTASPVPLSVHWCARPLLTADLDCVHSSNCECGVGIIFQEKEKIAYNDWNCSVSALSVGGPAETCKQIQVGDVLLKIDGVSVVGRRLKDLGPLMLGPVGSAVALEFKRGPAWRDGEGKTYFVDLHRRWAHVGLQELPNRD